MDGGCFGSFIRFISLLLTVSFFTTDVAHAAPGLGFSPTSILTNPSLLKISPSFAKVTAIYQGSQPKLLIHIQDAHTNLSAQENLSNVLKELIEKYGVNTVFIEGGTRDDSLTFLRPLAAAHHRSQVAKEYLVKGELNGAEYLNLSTDLNMRILGVEDGRLYRKNLRDYSRITKDREAVLNYIIQIQKRVSQLKRQLFSKDLLSVDDFLEQFRKKEKTFTDYHDRLSKAATACGINLLDTPHFFALKELKAKEEHIDPNEYPNLIRYAEYLGAYRTLDLSRLLEECRSLEERIFEETLIDRDTLTLHQIDRYLGTLQKLFSLQADKEDFLDYSKNKKDVKFETVVLLAFLNKKLYDLGNYEDVLEYLPLLEDNKDKIESFYRLTEKRDEAFMRNVEKNNPRAAVLITGGYHTPHLKTLMQQKGFSYVVVTPNIDHETNIPRYEKLLLSQLRNKRHSEPFGGVYPERSRGTQGKLREESHYLGLLAALERQSIPAIRAELLAAGKAAGARLNKAHVGSRLSFHGGSEASSGINYLAIAGKIENAFDRYYMNDEQIVLRSPGRFLNRQWTEAVVDQKDRVKLYTEHLNQIQTEVTTLLGAKAAEINAWNELKAFYWHKVFSRLDSDLARTFFYSVFRRVFSDRPDVLPLVLSQDGVAKPDSLLPKKISPFTNYSLDDSPESIKNTVLKILSDLPFGMPEPVLDYYSKQAVLKLEKELGEVVEPSRIEILKPIFYRNKGAYILGKIISKKTGKLIKPIAFAFLNPKEGVQLHAVLTNPNDINRLFSSTRANFRVGVRGIYREVFDFLDSMELGREFADIYSVVGFLQPAKVKFLQRLEDTLRPGKMFQRAPGRKGTVMEVMTLEEFPYVFKIIREKSFKYDDANPRDDVMSKYRDAHERDRVGRKQDAMHFQKLVFPKSAFSEELLKEFEEQFGLDPKNPHVRIIGDEVHILDLYVQRKVIPFNLYLDDPNVSSEDKEKAVVDLGQCIKDLAAGGIYLRDLQVRNFGVTTFGRVVSYDNDDMSDLENWYFIDMPEDIRSLSMERAKKIEATKARAPVRSEDIDKIIIPEIDFEVIVPLSYVVLFNRYHHDIFTADYWNGVKKNLENKTIPDFYPYPESEFLPPLNAAAGRLAASPLEILGELGLKPTGQIRYARDYHPPVLECDLTVVLHGSTPANADGVLQGLGNSGAVNQLSEEGYHEVELGAALLWSDIGEEVRANPEKFVFLSTKTDRSVQTKDKYTEYFRSKGVSIRAEDTDNDLIINRGQWTGKSLSKLMEEDHSDFESYTLSDAAVTPKDGESFLDFLNRVREVIKILNEKYKGKHVVIFGHATFVWALKVLLRTEEVQAKSDKGEAIDFYNLEVNRGKPHRFGAGSPKNIFEHIDETQRKIEALQRDLSQTLGIPYRSTGFKKFYAELSLGTAQRGNTIFTVGERNQILAVDQKTGQLNKAFFGGKGLTKISRDFYNPGGLLLDPRLNVLYVISQSNFEGPGDLPKILAIDIHSGRPAQNIFNQGVFMEANTTSGAKRLIREFEQVLLSGDDLLALISGSPDVLKLDPKTGRTKGSFARIQEGRDRKEWPRMGCLVGNTLFLLYGNISKCDSIVALNVDSMEVDRSYFNEGIYQFKSDPPGQEQLYSIASNGKTLFVLGNKTIGEDGRHSSWGALWAIDLKTGKLDGKKLNQGAYFIKDSEYVGEMLFVADQGVILHKRYGNDSMVFIDPTRDQTIHPEMLRSDAVRKLVSRLDETKDLLGRLLTERDLEIAAGKHPALAELRSFYWERTDEALERKFSETEAAAMRLVITAFMNRLLAYGVAVSENGASETILQDVIPEILSRISNLNALIDWLKAAEVLFVHRNAWLNSSTRGSWDWVKKIEEARGILNAGDSFDISETFGRENDIKIERVPNPFKIRNEAPVLGARLTHHNSELIRRLPLFENVRNRLNYPEKFAGFILQYFHTDQPIQGFLDIIEERYLSRLSDKPDLQKANRAAVKHAVVADKIFKTYEAYYREFLRITALAQDQFEQRQWSEILASAKNRIQLYSKWRDPITEEVKKILEGEFNDENIWLKMMKSYYRPRIVDRYDADLATTFFYSVMRRMGLFADYQDDGLAEESAIKLGAPYRSYLNEPINQDLIRRILLDCQFKIPFRDFDVRTQAVSRQILEVVGTAQVDSIEILNSLFFRNKGAYVIGRILCRDGSTIPLVFALENETQEGIQIDAVLTTERDVSNVFTYTRSNFHVLDINSEPTRYRELANFLETIMPNKDRAALYSSIGFIHPGKIKVLKELRDYLKDHPEKKFVLTDGVEGNVMVTFMLPATSGEISYDDKTGTLVREPPPPRGRVWVYF